MTPKERGITTTAQNIYWTKDPHSTIRLAVPIDPTLVAAIVSAIVAFAVLGLDRLFIEPRKWLRRYETRMDERAIALHCWLISILKACREKAKRQEEQRSKPSEPHLLESADIWKLEEIFEKKSYLLSDALKRKWYDLQRKDEFFEMIRVRHREEYKFPLLKTPQGELLGEFQGPTMRHEVVGADLTDMEKQAEDDLAALQDRYERLAGFRLTS